MSVLGLTAVLMLLAMIPLLFRKRRRFLPPNQRLAPSEPAFDLAELHVMLANGKITQEEFDRLKEITMRQRAAAGQVAIRPDSSKSHGFEVIIKENRPK